MTGRVTQAMLAIDGGAPVRDDYLYFGAPWIGEEEIAEVVDTLRSGWIGTGKKVQAFEKAFQEYTGAAHAVAVSSCTAGLHLALLVSGVGPGDEVVTTPMTFAATINTILHTGATPVFVDIDPATLNIDLGKVPQAVTPRTKALLPVHFGGQPLDLDRLYALAADHRVAVVEDAAHAIGSRYKGKAVGGFGPLAAFSFYANKNITTAEGGMVTTGDAALAERMRILRLHGLDADAWKRYTAKDLMLNEIVEAGYKYNLTDLAASLGIHQLRKAEVIMARKEHLAARYDAAFAGRQEFRLQTRATDPGSRHGLHLYILLLDLDRITCTRNEFVAALRAENIGAGIHYGAIHLHAFYRQRYGYRPGSFPEAERVGASTLTLPLNPQMTDRDADDCIAAVEKVLARYRR